MNSPADQLAERFAFDPPPDLRAWFDEDAPARCAGREFSDSLNVARIMDPEPGELWGGLMLPDTLPVLGNKYGDWLCLRLAFSGEVKDWILWRHGGGDWISVGKTFAEALLFESISPHCRGDGAQTSTAAAWALDWLNRAGEPTPGAHIASADPRKRLQALLDWRPSQAAHRDLASLALECPLHDLANPSIAAELNIPWEPEFIRLAFDPAQADATKIRRLAEKFDQTSETLIQQDWREAEVHALAALKHSSEAGWAFDLAGWAAERRGDLTQAQELYRRGLNCSAFSDDSVLFRTHWFPAVHGKFCASRLHELQSDLSETAPGEYAALLVSGSTNIHALVAEFWLRKVEQSVSAGDFEKAHQSYWKAGWDLGFMPLEGFSPLLESMAENASQGGAKGLQRLAELHRRFLLRTDSEDRDSTMAR